MTGIDLETMLARAHRALVFAEMLAPLGGPVGAQGVIIAKAVLDALDHLHSDGDLLNDVMRAQTQEALDALRPRLDAMEAQRQAMMDEG